MLTQQTAKKTIRVKAPAPDPSKPWLDALAGRYPFTFRFAAADRRIFNKPDLVAPVPWIERNRVVTHGSLAGSTMQMEISPHLAGQLEAAAHPSVRAIVVCAAPQTAKTTMVHSAISYGMKFAPGPILSIYPGQTAARENCQERVQKMIDASPSLRAMKTKNPDDFSKTLIALQHLSWYFGWAGSAMSMSDRSIKYLDLQEVDKYPERPNAKEAGIMEFAEIRVTAFPHDHKIFITSSPTDEAGPVWQALTKDCQVVFKYHVNCPRCTEPQEMVFEQIKWPHGEDGHSVDYLQIKAEKLAWYECVHCGARWDDHLRDMAIQSRTWRAVSFDDNGNEVAGDVLARYLAMHRPERIGFHQPSWISRFVSLSTVAADFLQANDKNRSRSRRRKLLHNFLNKHKAEPVFDWEKQRKESIILELRDERPMGLVPGGGQVAALVAGIDTQDNSIVYVIRAIGWGLNQTTWKIRYGEIFSDPGDDPDGKTDFQKLEQILFEDVYRDSDGLYYPVHLGVQDAMGHRTDEVYDFTRRFPTRMRAYKGAPGRRSTPYTETVRDKFPATGKPIPGGAALLTCDSHYYKDSLDEQLKNRPGEPGCYYMCKETSKGYAKQMTAEYKDDETKLWKCPEGKANHFWDCEMMAVIAADYLQVRFWPQTGGGE